MIRFLHGTNVNTTHYILHFWIVLHDNSLEVNQQNKMFKFRKCQNLRQKQVLNSIYGIFIYFFFDVYLQKPLQNNCMQKMKRKKNSSKYRPFLDYIFFISSKTKRKNSNDHFGMNDFLSLSLQYIELKFWSKQNRNDSFLL